MASNRIYIQVDFQSQDANAAITSLNQNIADIGTKADTATKQATAGVKGFSVSIDQARSAIDSLAQSITGLGIAQMIREVLALGDALLRVQISFQRFGEGASALRSVQALAEETGLSFQGLLESANSLKNAGVPILQIAGVLKIFADQAAYAGVKQEQMNDAVETFAKLSAKGFVTGKELTIFKEVGLDVLPILAEKTGLSIQKLRSEMHQFSASAVQDLILVTAQAQSMGAAAAVAAQLPSAHFQRLKNDIAALADELVKVLAPALISVAEALRGITQDAAAAVAGFNMLPEWAKKLTEVLLALAFAVAGVSIAFALWNTLPAAFAWIPKITGILSAMAAAMLEIAAAGGGVMDVLVPLGLGFEALVAAIAPLTPVILAAAAAWEIYEYAAYRANTSQATTDAMKKAFADRQALAEQAQQLRDSLPAAQQKVADTARGKHSYQSETIDQLQTQIEQMKTLHKDLIEADEKAIDAANKRAAELLNEAMKRSLIIGKESIEALTYAYKDHFAAVTVAGADNAARLAVVQKAYVQDVITEIKKIGNELDKENEKALQESVAVRRKIAIAQAEVVPDQTYAGRESLANTVAGDDEAKIREQFSLRMDKQDELIAKQIDGVRKSGLAEAQKVVQIADLESKLREYNYDQIKLRDEEIALHRLEAEKKVNELIEQHRKELAEQDLQDQVTLIQQAGSLRIAALSVDKADTLPERLQQLRDVQAEQIAIIQKTSDARIAAAKREYDYFASQHPGAANEDSRLEEQQKFEHARTEISREAEVQIQLDRFNLWKESNDAIIEEQKKMYESIKGALDKVWDALLSKSQSVWTALGNALKSAVMNAMKEIVTSRLAAQIAGIFGYGDFAFKRGIMGIYEPPTPSGAGAPPEVKALTAVTSGLLSPGSNPQIAVQNYATDAFAQVANATQAEEGSPDAIRAAATGGSLPAAAVAAMRAELAPAASRAVQVAPGGGGALAVATSAAQSPAAAGGRATGVPGGQTGMAQTIARLKSSLNIGQPIVADRDTVDAFGNTVEAGSVIPWENATSMQRLDVMAHSPGVAQLGLGVGSMLAIAGLQKGGPKGGAEALTGSTIAGASLASMFPALGLSMAGGALFGVGMGSVAYGLERGGKVGAGFDIAGGAAMGAVIGSIVPGIGTLIGAGIGAAAGAIAGGMRMLFPGMDQKIRTDIKRIYGIDIPNKQIRDQIAKIITDNYGGNVSIGLYSSEVQNIVRLYSASTGQLAGLPRPEYNVTMAQQGGQLTTQPVYSAGQMVKSPYSGLTTYQYAQAGLYLQLNPNQANQLLTGQVVNAMQQNPATIAQANAAALSAGSSRYATQGSLLEPNQVTA